jgi:hypothetical protein
MENPRREIYSRWVERVILRKYNGKEEYPLGIWRIRLREKISIIRSLRAAPYRPHNCCMPSELLFVY